MKSPGHNRYDARVLLLVVTLGFTTVATASPTKHLAHPVSIPDVEQPTVEHLPTAAAALEKVLRIPARVIAVGEFHQTTSTTAIRSSLSRFADEMLSVDALLIRRSERSFVIIFPRSTKVQETQP